MGVPSNKITCCINAPSVAPALLAFDRSTAGSDGTDSAVPAIENLLQPSAQPLYHQADATGKRNGVAPWTSTVRAFRRHLPDHGSARTAGCRYSFSTSSPASRGASAGWNFSRSSPSSRAATCGLSRR
ncbi:hypothetical protein XaplCFBP3123_00185 [Xanthomonas arboricola pv. populi]|nr:hypothetical protein XaplCFBP3123_00185 [Xanthomonas arboricola pv. populi]